MRSAGGQYWRLEELKCFDEFLERRFLGSRRKAYYLMSIHEHLPPQARKQLKEVGWAKGVEPAKVARRDRQRFDCATWLHKARQMPKEEFKLEVEKELTGKETEPWEIIFFKLTMTLSVAGGFQQITRVTFSDRARLRYQRLMRSYRAHRRADPSFSPLEIARRPGPRVYDVDSRVSLHAQFAIASEDPHGRVVLRLLGSALQCGGNHSEWRLYAGGGAAHEFPTVASELVFGNPSPPSARSRGSALAELFQCWRCAHN